MWGADVEDGNSAYAPSQNDGVDNYSHRDFFSETERGPDKRSGDIVAHMVFIVPT